MDTTLTDNDYIYDMNDDWILSATEDMNGQGVRWGIDTDKEKMLSKTLEQMFYKK